MKRTSHRKRRPNILVSREAAYPAGLALAFLTACLAALAGSDPPDSSEWFVGVMVFAIAVAPVTVLAVTPQALGFGVLELPGRARLPKTIPWAGVGEVLLSAEPGGVTVGVVSQGPSASGDVAVDVPGADRPTVAAAIARVAPAVTLREATRAEIVTRTRRPLYVAPGRTPRALLPGLAFTAASAALALAVVLVGDGSAPWYAFAPFWIGVTATCTWRFPLAVGETGIDVRSWRRTRTLPWAVVDAVRITAVGELTVLVAAGGLPSVTGEALTFRIRRADLADLRAVLRAYAPPEALAAW